MTATKLTGDFRVAGEIAQTSIARLVEVLADADWDISERGDELELRGPTLSLGICGGRREGAGTTFLVSALLKRMDFTQVKALLERIGTRLATHGILYSFEPDDPAEDGLVLIEHPGFAPS